MDSDEQIIGTGSYDKLNQAGYLIVPVLEPEKAKALAATVTERALQLVFVNPGYPVDPKDPDSAVLFVDPKRRDTIGARKATCRGGNSRQPIINRTTGMIDIHFEPELLENIVFNPDIVEASADVMDVPAEQLVYALGPERVSVKAPTAPAMKKHSDYNFFIDAKKLNYPYRIQSLVTLDIDPEIEPAKSGTLCVLSYFHHFIDFAACIFHPKYGIPSCRFPGSSLKSRFLEFPSYFDTKYLHMFRMCVDLYLQSVTVEPEQHPSIYEHFSGSLEDHRAFIELACFWHIHEVFYDKDSKLLLRYIRNMRWTPIAAKPGDMIFWHQYLPHYSCPNKSSISRVVSYVNLYPAGADWNESYQRKWVAEQFRTAKSRYTTNADDIKSSTARFTNPEEYQDLVDRGLIDRVVQLSQTDDTRKRLSGQLPVDF